MGSGRVIACPPFFDHLLGLLQFVELALVQTFNPELAVEAFDVAVLSGFPRIDEVQLHSSLLRPSEHGLTGELRSVVHHYYLGQTGEVSRFVQDSGHPLTGNGGVYNNRRTLPAELIYKGQRSEPAAVPQAVMNEVH